MLRNKFRLRFELEPLSPEIVTVFDKNTELAKQFLKIERNLVLSNLVSYHLVMNITFDNLVFLCNYLFFKNEELTALTPPNLVEHFDEVFEVKSN